MKYTTTFSQDRDLNVETKTKSLCDTKSAHLYAMHTHMHF